MSRNGTPRPNGYGENLSPRVDGAQIFNSNYHANDKGTDGMFKGGMKVVSELEPKGPEPRTGDGRNQP